jgi:hypothetical protein
MKQVEIMSEETLINTAIKLLIDHIGTRETSRFLALSQLDRVDSLKRHHAWQKMLDKDTFFNEVFK